MVREEEMWEGSKEGYQLCTLEKLTAYLIETDTSELIHPI